MPSRENTAANATANASDFGSNARASAALSPRSSSAYASIALPVSSRFPKFRYCGIFASGFFERNLKSLQRSAALSEATRARRILPQNFSPPFRRAGSRARRKVCCVSVRACRRRRRAFRERAGFWSDEIPDASSSSPRNALYSELPFAAESSETAKFSISAQYFLSKLFA